MKRLVLFLVLILATPSFAELPYSEHGWTEREAAAHLLSRFTYGAQPGDIDRVLELGPERWLEEQLQGKRPDPILAQKLSKLPTAYRLSNRNLVAEYPPPPELRRLAKQNGLTNSDGRPDRRAMAQYLSDNGLKAYRQIFTTLFAQKLYHARYSKNELREVLTQFWFNHFNVAASHNQAKTFLLSYERDAIRPNALGKFRNLLGATAKHPAMLLYLDNAISRAGKDSTTTFEMEMDQSPMNLKRKKRRKQRLKRAKKGINENYARELLELHTLGVDGGYNQKDVQEVARVFTGWTVKRGRRQKAFDRLSQMKGSVNQGDFYFLSAFHDAGSKSILGRIFSSGSGLDEGERVLDLLAIHPSTARHIAKKMAVRFVSDNPAEATVKELNRAFVRSGGDIRAVVRAIARSDEFWSPKARYSKIKSPFELLISAARALEADLYPTTQLYSWLGRMGQPLYNYQAPSGFPDRANYWVSSSNILNRVNFGLYAANGRIPGFRYTPEPHRNLKSVVLELMPTQNVAKVVKRLQPLYDSPDKLKLDKPGQTNIRPNLGGRLPSVPLLLMSPGPEERKTTTMIGLTLGSPEFQKR